MDCARQASVSITNSRSLLKLMSIESVLPSNHLVLCCLLLLPSVFASIRVFPSELPLRIRWPKYWSFSFSTKGGEDTSEGEDLHVSMEADIGLTTPQAGDTWSLGSWKRREEPSPEPLEGASPAHTSTSDSTLQPGRE